MWQGNRFSGCLSANIGSLKTIHLTFSGCLIPPRSSESNTMIQIRNIHKTFGSNTILRGVDLDVAKGQVVVILGPSGSGKTTFLRCLNALEIPARQHLL